MLFLLVFLNHLKKILLKVFRNELIEVPTFEDDEKISAEPGAPVVAAPAYE
jgi:hypothetical protein